MGTQSFFNGSYLETVETPDLPLPDVLNVTARSALDALGVGDEPGRTATVKAEAIDKLAPTPTPAAGGLRDEWAEPPTTTPAPGSVPLDAADADVPSEEWTKSKLGAYIEANSDERLGTNENKDVFLAKALDIYETLQLG